MGLRDLGIKAGKLKYLIWNNWAVHISCSFRLSAARRVTVPGISGSYVQSKEYGQRERSLELSIYKLQQNASCGTAGDMTLDDHSWTL